MGQTRATLLTYLAGTLHRVATAARLAETDSADGYGYALDSAFELLGYGGDTTTLTLADDLTGAARALARYYGLWAIYTHLAAQVDTNEPTGAGQADPGLQARPARQLFAQVEKLLREAREIVAGYGYAVDSEAPQMSLGRLNLDFRTPVEPRDW